jgi:MOSC domain-containing protein YiiM
MASTDLLPITIPPPTTLLELRTSKLKQFGTVLSGIDKRAIDVPLYVSPTGLTDDEHDLTFHGGVDKAIHQYDHSHYAFWQLRHPQAAAKFIAGGFGENFVAEGFTEENICIGDVVRVGPKHSTLTGGDNGSVLEVSLARQPCFKLNQRFGVKNLVPQTHQENKTGWFTVDVVSANGTTRLNVGSEQNLLGVMRAAGLEVASSCETGSCGTCRIELKEGKVVHKGKGLTTEEQEKEMLCCVSRGDGHIVVELDI